MKAFFTALLFSILSFAQAGENEEDWEWTWFQEEIAEEFKDMLVEASKELSLKTFIGEA